MPAMPGPLAAALGEGGDGGRGATLARAGASAFLAVPDAAQPELVPVGEGGRGRWRRNGYGYGYYGWGPPPVYYAPPPPRVYYAPPPRAYYAPPPPVYYAPPPPVYYAPAPGISLNFRF
ncbi:hypothetical protein GXW76_09295 [Roseomonas soli]|uniref:Uncharacterized protein n=2 Tax=Neoroseomonas soli TaxID=1081025 RepID=A0A9X9WW36_9PROT|nr:hypothetical protein [Neoroseomonas soli]